MGSSSTILGSGCVCGLSSPDWPVGAEVWSDHGVLASKHVLLILATCTLRVHVDVDVLSDCLVCVMLHGLAVCVGLDVRSLVLALGSWWLECLADVVGMDATNLSSLVSDLVDLVQGNLEGTGAAHWEVLSAELALLESSILSCVHVVEVRSAKLGDCARIIEILEELGCVLATKAWCILRRKTIL